MSESLINLSKAVKISLEKISAPKIVAQCGAVFDVSGSAESMYSKRPGSSSSVMQRLIDRVFAPAMEFDDNGQLDAWLFHSRVHEMEPIVESMFGAYVDKYIHGDPSISRQIWGGTAYAPAMSAVYEHYYPGSTASRPVPRPPAPPAPEPKKGFFSRLFGGKDEPAPAPVVAAPAPEFKPKSALKLQDPAYIVFVTDGESGDEAATLALLEEHKDKQVFFMLVGITNGGSKQEFPFLEKLKKQFGHVDFYNGGDIDSVSNEELYDSLLTKKFVNWYVAARKVA